ncbi:MULTISPECIES: YihY/virulence factor BrkB family protein [unclassified Streptomyces]|uniref:YihY/virulence factor BrkB family protein n=1 Tax=unclassified Streptomyces TaxID=2593676 RepID=UPI00088EE077|nr:MULTISPECIES: YihY/virulence factor BrkB family protein [unclassified Streptomyces]PBC84570.1 membrane protein [Streptomyces sp. 2321.6]SDR28842.1 membrane protein [Streptomyces sp. KS_16]SED36221.1 membrane protein [Streptomyces sp. 2133.1]SNC70653.1 membrane protein [Streptomyces sp. 2114.4]
MDWLSKLPVIGPAVTWLMTTHLWRAYERMLRVHWTRLAAAITFTSFVALFPLLTVAAAIGTALLSDERVHHLEGKIAEQLPGISGQLDIAALVDNATTIGLVAGAALLLTGIGWVDSLRDCLRAVWEKDNEKTNFFLGKLRDGVLLFGVGGVAVLSLACSTFASAAVGKVAEAIGLAEGGVGSVLLSVAGFVIAVLADFLLLAYILTRLPGVHPPRRAVVVAGLLGAIGFELLKLLLSGYLQGVASRSMYGAFGTPVALLLWINFTAKLLVYCASWTATEGEQRAEAEDLKTPDGPAGRERPEGQDRPRAA